MPYSVIEVMHQIRRADTTAPKSAAIAPLEHEIHDASLNFTRQSAQSCLATPVRISTYKNASRCTKKYQHPS